MKKSFDDIPAQAFIPGYKPDIKITIRRARSADMKPLHEACFPERSLAQFGDSFRRSLEAQENGKRVHLVALSGKEMVGSGQLVRFSDVAEIADLAVAPAYQGQGIGTALISVLEEIAFFAGYRDVEIGVMKANRQAVALYKRLGYMEERTLSIGDSAKVLVLRKSLLFE